MWKTDRCVRKSEKESEYKLAPFLFFALNYTYYLYRNISDFAKDT